MGRGKGWREEEDLLLGKSFCEAWLEGRRRRRSEGRLWTAVHRFYEAARPAGAESRSEESLRKRWTKIRSHILLFRDALEQAKEESIQTDGLASITSANLAGESGFYSHASPDARCRRKTSITEKRRRNETGPQDQPATSFLPDVISSSLSSSLTSSGIISLQGPSDAEEVGRDSVLEANLQHSRNKTWTSSLYLHALKTYSSKLKGEEKNKPRFRFQACFDYFVGTGRAKLLKVKTGRPRGSRNKSHENELLSEGSVEADDSNFFAGQTFSNRKSDDNKTSREETNNGLFSPPASPSPPVVQPPDLNPFSTELCSPRRTASTEKFDCDLYPRRKRKRTAEVTFNSVLEFLRQPEPPEEAKLQREAWETLHQKISRFLQDYEITPNPIELESFMKFREQGGKV